MWQILSDGIMSFYDEGSNENIKEIIGNVSILDYLTFSSNPHYTTVMMPSVNSNNNMNHCQSRMGPGEPQSEPPAIVDSPKPTSSGNTPKLSVFIWEEVPGKHKNSFE